MSQTDPEPEQLHTKRKTTLAPQAGFFVLNLFIY